MRSCSIKTCILLFLAGTFLLPATARPAVPPTPTQPTATCDATISGQCYVNGSFTLTASSPGADHYRVCRSNDVTGWGGCDVVISSQSGPSLTVSGSHLPSEGVRRAYRYRACDAQQNCSAYGPPIYVHFDSTPPPVPSQPTTSCDAIIGGNCWVNGSFTLNASSAGADHYQVCRSNDVTNWGGCSVVINSQSGPSLTVNGSHLPSEGARRAYRYRACDALLNCSAYGSPLYAHLDSIPPDAPAPTVATGCDAQFNNLCQVNSPFVVSTTAPSGTDRLKVCRSNDTGGFAGCAVEISSDSGAEYGVAGSDLPGHGLRRAYRFSACDQVNNCSAWSQNTPVYVYGDNTLLQCPTLQGSPQPIAEARVCPAGSTEKLFEPWTPTARASDAAVHKALGKSLAEYSLETVDLAKVMDEVERSGELNLPIEGRLRRLVLEPVDLRAPSFVQLAIDADGERVLPTEPTHTYRGHLGDDPSSAVRLLIHPELLMGYVELEGKRYFVDPAYRFEAGGGADRLVIYEESQLRQEAGVSCGLTEAREHSQKIAGEEWRLDRESPTLAKGAVQWVEIATDADYEYWDSHGRSTSATSAHIQGILNMVNGFYSAVDLTLTITQQRVFTTQNDPYETCNLMLQWCEIFQEWERFQGSVQRDVAYLFSGKKMFGRFGLNGQPVRIRGTSGFSGTVCAQPSRAYVISNQYREAGLVAHELGHAFDAGHDPTSECPDPDCGLDACGASSGGDGGPVMCGPIQSPVTGFSDDSVDEITDFVNGSGGTCLSPVP